MPNKTKKIQQLFIIYWFLLAYTIAILVWWFIALNQQNKLMADYKKKELKIDAPSYQQKIDEVEIAESRKKAGFIGEGITFFLMIMAGALFVFRATRRQLNASIQQQHFMMALTHELKTPIAVAKLNLETLQKRKLDEQQTQRLIQTTLQETNRLNSLCNNMLLSSQIETSGFKISEEEINFSDLINESIQDFKMRFIEKNITRQIQENIFIVGDKLLLQIAANNLIDNAIKYSPKNSTVTLALSQQNKNILFKIIDEGNGISKTEKENVFNKFYRSENAITQNAKGTGLGLYLAKKIIDQHKGKIFLTDNTPSGCIFTIALPILD